MKCGAFSSHGMKRFTDKTITEFPALIESLRIRPPQRLCASIARNFCQA